MRNKKTSEKRITNWKNHCPITSVISIEADYDWFSSFDEILIF